MLKRIWTPAWASEHGPLIAFVRVQLLCPVLLMSALVLTPAAFLSAYFLHLRGLTGAGIVILGVGVASLAVLEGTRIWCVFHLGHWIGWKQEPIWPKEQPMRFWTRTAICATLLTVYASAAVFLIWSGVSWAAGG